MSNYVGSRKPALTVDAKLQPQRSSGTLMLAIVFFLVAMAAIYLIHGVG